MPPIGAFGARVGVGSRMAWGRAGGGVLATGRLGSGGGGGGTGGGDSTGLGGSTNSLKISTGMTISAVRRSRPLCSAHRTATWKSTTLPAMAILRERPRAVGAGEEKRSDTISHSSMGFPKGARMQQNRYERQIHQTELATRIRLPPSAERSSMLCFPKWSWQAGLPLSLFRWRAQLQGARHCTAPPRRARNLHIDRIGWRRQVQTEFRRRSCRLARVLQFHDPKLDGRCKQSWQFGGFAGC